MTRVVTRTGRPDYRPAPKPGLVVQAIDDEVVIYDPDTDAVHRLEPTAASVWARLDGRRPLRTVAAELATAFGVAEDVVQRDIADLDAALRNLGLLAGSVAVRGSTGRQSTRLPVEDFNLGGQPPPDLRFTTRLYRGLEHAFDISTNDPDVRDYLEEILTDLADDSAGEVARYDLAALPDARYLVLRDRETVVVTGRLDRALAVLLWDINAEVVRRSTQTYPLVHAAAAVRDGLAVLLAAAPESGKTTTVAGLVTKAGFRYLTDEALAIEPAGLLALPYPKALSIDRGSWEILPHLRPAHGDRVTGQWQLPASAIRPDAVAGPAPIRFVVEPAYDRNAETRLEPVSRAAMLVRLVDSTFNFQHAPQRNLAVLARVIERIECYRLPISRLDEGVRLIEELFDEIR